MRILRGIAGALLWILAVVLGLVALVLCITVILLPAGLPLLGVSRRLFGMAVRLMLPREMAHPVKQSRKEDCIDDRLMARKATSRSRSQARPPPKLDGRS